MRTYRLGFFCFICLLPWALIAGGNTSDNESSNVKAAGLHRCAQPSGDTASAQEQFPTVLACGAFSSCEDSSLAGFERAGNYLVASQGTTPASEKRCAVGIGADHKLYGKIIPPPFRPTSDVWMSGRVYFPSGFVLPQHPRNSSGQACNIGVHLWRLSDSLSQPRLSMDFNIPAGTDHVQLFVIRTTGTVPNTILHEYVSNTDYHPADLEHQGKWQFWQVHIRLGTPGRSNGFIRFYADGKLIASMERQPFLPLEADQNWGFRYADLQSNIGVATAECDALWPEANGWLVDSVWVTTNNRYR